MNTVGGNKMKSENIERTVQQGSLAAPKQALRKVLAETIKTGIIKSNLIVMFAGITLALYIHNIAFSDKIGAIVLATLGSGLVIGAAGTFNNLYDRDIDKIMDRTKNRPTATGRMQLKNALILGIVMTLAGLGFLYAASPLAAFFGFIGLFFYVVPYTMWSKRRTIYNTEIGSISGAVPPLIGWAAISNDFFHPAALGLFVIMVLWQMPHFYAIAIRRHDEYKAADIPMLPVIKGNRRTYIQTNVYLVLLTLSSFLFLPVSSFIVGVSFVLSAAWLAASFICYRRMDSKKWATTMFIFSLNHMTILFTVVIGFSLIALFFN